MNNFIILFFGLLVGGLIGAAFGAVQNAASLRNEKKQEKGILRSGWAIMPGSMTRVAFLMIALVLVQIGIPMLFTGEIQWIVSAGVVIGYGWKQYLQLRRRINNSYGTAQIH
jgi:hypothetical protein